MFNVFKPQTFFLHFTFWQKCSAFIKLVTGTPSLPKLIFVFPKYNCCLTSSAGNPLQECHCAAGGQKWHTKKQNGSRSWIAATTRVRTSSFHPCGGRDATHGIWAGRLCLPPFSSALKSLVIVHIKCHCDWPALWNHGMRFPLKIKHPPCIDEKRGLLPRRLASLVLWWSDRLLWPIAYNLPSIRRNFLLIAVVQPSSRHRRHLTSSCQNPNRPDHRHLVASSQVPSPLDDPSVHHSFNLLHIALFCPPDLVVQVDVGSVSQCQRVSGPWMY